MRNRFISSTLLALFFTGCASNQPHEAHQSTATNNPDLAVVLDKLRDSLCRDYSGYPDMEPNDRSNWIDLPMIPSRGF